MLSRPTVSTPFAQMDSQLSRCQYFAMAAESLEAKAALYALRASRIACSSAETTDFAAEIDEAECAGDATMPDKRIPTSNALIMTISLRQVDQESGAKMGQLKLTPYLSPLIYRARSWPAGSCTQTRPCRHQELSLIHI